ncbi:small G protein signaling modulator 2-like isoform X2 [Eupeodes corollae]|uniref:small G protein signaling modulator 2-like isoform X2 n=1 Tax=Eupeodes corollae TaxID=290404 RepID=UPI002493300A|nr:small G protein signaling modulator 2-like isoform X2 [Eupeodes corollae]
MILIPKSKIDFKERLIWSVKREVKQLMEEAVTKKFIHEESNSVTALCAAVEACLSQGLRRRALGLFKTSSTTALLHKIAKSCPEAEIISKKVQESESSDKRSASISTDSIHKTPLLKKGNSCSVSAANPPTSSAPIVKYLWIRLALFEKKLAKIIEYLAANAYSFYDKDALVADPDLGSILSSLLVGPCALEFTRAKTADHYWTDPHADELVQRHRISTGTRQPSGCQRPIINFKRSLHANSEDSTSTSFKSSGSVSAAKDYVESLHQNSRATLLYGKNNVMVLPKDVKELMPGYLSLHQHIQTLIVKWTPNQLMNGHNEVEVNDKSSYWDYALNINVNEIVYVHCHQNRGEDAGGTIILVGQDGVQRPPIHFPEGGHMQAFLSCLETGLLPHGQLDPPLWSHRGIGKLLAWPKLGRRRIISSLMDSSEENPIDYVFRIVSKSNHEDFLAVHPILELGRTSPRRAQLSSCSTNGSSDYSSKSISIDQVSIDSPLIQGNQTASIELVCSTMRRQIISRAFYGWLAYCRHLSTVRTHLSGLVNGRITPELGSDEKGLTKERWDSLSIDGVVTNETEVFRLVYFGGVTPDLRKDVWPYLLGHYSFGSTPEEREKLDEKCKHYYETTMSEWLAVEAIVRQRDMEKTAKAVAKLSSSSGSAEKNRVDLDEDIDNEVFLEQDISYTSDPYQIDSNRLACPAARNMKHSTDSGNVEDVETHDGTISNENLKILPTAINSNAINKIVSIEEDNLGGSTVDGGRPSGKVLKSDPCSPSTSSYETVGNEFAADGTENDVQNILAQGADFVASEIPEFHSIDDIKGEFAEVFDEDSISEPKTLRPPAAVIVTDASIDLFNIEADHIHFEEEINTEMLPSLQEDIAATSMDVLQEPKSTCVSPASSNGGVYSCELLENFGLNLHRIEKDVQRCDRNYWYFANENLDKLRNVISTYVWEHLEVGYMQGMCDLVAPLLVIFDDESMSYSCFCKLMERMIENFPNGGAMDMHFANMRSLIQILDSEMYDLMDSHGDYTHFYFCYRWFLLDFKRELIYADVFSTWEVIWAAKHVASTHFVLFLALALLETYRDIILSNSMDFTDVIKFFNEMAERHNAQSVLQLARSLALQLQMIIENK